MGNRKHIKKDQRKKITKIKEELQLKAEPKANKWKTTKPNKTHQLMTFQIQPTALCNNILQ